jgi:PAS domain S-box-containing protein
MPRGSGEAPLNASVAHSLLDSAVLSKTEAARPQLLPLSELAAANRQRDALYLLSERLHSARTTKAIYDAALDAIESALSCDRSSILLFDENDTMQFVAWRGLSSEYREAVAGHSPWKRNEGNPTPIPVPNVANADFPEELKATVLREGIHATAFMPVVSEGVLIGKFMAYFREPYAFTQDDLAVSHTIARQLAYALLRHEADTKLRAREDELADELTATRMLQAVSLEMAHEVDITALYEKLIDGAQSIMHADFASMQQLYPHQGEHGELLLLAYRGFTPEAAQFWTWVRARSACTCGRALVSKERVIAPDVEEAPYLAGTSDLETYRQTGIRAVQSTPLLSRRGELVGMISTHWRVPHEPSQRDLRLLDILARLAADLIQRKTDDEELRRREERSRTLTQLLADVPWQARRDGAFEELQPAWENFTGQTWDAHAGHGWFDAFHPEDRDGARGSWAAACFEAQPFEYRARIWHAQSGRYRPCVIRATPILRDDGSLREWVGACTEVHGTGG